MDARQTPKATPRNIKSWKVQTTSNGVELTLITSDGVRHTFTTQAGESLAFDISKAARGWN